MIISSTDQDAFNKKQTDIRQDFISFVQQDFINPLTLKITFKPHPTAFNTLNMMLLEIQYKVVGIDDRYISWLDVTHNFSEVGFFLSKFSHSAILTGSVAYTVYGLARSGPWYSKVVVAYQEDFCVSKCKSHAVIYVTEHFAAGNELYTIVMPELDFDWSNTLSQSNFVIEIRQLKQICIACRITVSLIPHILDVIKAPNNASSIVHFLNRYGDILTQPMYTRISALRVNI